MGVGGACTALSLKDVTQLHKSCLLTSLWLEHGHMDWLQESLGTIAFIWWPWGLIEPLFPREKG